MNVGRIRQIFHDVASAQSRVYLTGDRAFFEGRPVEIYPDNVILYRQDGDVFVWISGDDIVAIEKLKP